MSLVLENLRLLHQEMRQRGIDRARFDFRRNDVDFDVFFFTDTSPYRLLLGARGRNVAIDLEVHRGYAINTYLGDQFGALCDALGIRPNPNNKFSSKAFFEEFAKAIPQHLPANHKVKPNLLLRYRPHAGTSDGHLFCGWRDNSQAGKNVSPENLEKTRLILGERIFHACRERNISSCWTNNPDHPGVAKYEKSGYDVVP